MQTASTADYTFVLYAEDRAFTPAPGLEFTVANWSISYRAQDSILPGVIPSQMDLTVFGGFSIGDYRTMLGDAKGRYIIEMKKNLDLIWRGFLVPDLCSIELINGQRFVKLVFSDGFQMLDRRADFYQYTGVKSFTEQIWYAFENCNLFDAFDYFLVSQHRQPTNKGITTNQGGLWWTGCIQDGFWIIDGEYRTYLEVLNDICTTFSLQLFQDKGQLVFRSLEYKTPAWYNVYGIYGTFVARITPPALTSSETVFSDGLELYKPGIRELFVKHNKPNIQGIIKDESGSNKTRDNYYVSNVTPTGSNHMDLDSYLYARLSFDGGYPGGAVDFEFYVTVQFGNYYWNGTDWTTTPSFVTYHESRIFGPGPSLETIVHHINGDHLDALPTIGTEPVYYTVTGTQTSGYPADTIEVTATMYFAYHNANPDTVTYYADNTGKVNGETVAMETEIGDIWQTNAYNAALPGEIRCWVSAARTVDYGNIFWDTTNSLLIERLTYQLARKNYRPKQYYEIELDGFVSYNHTFNWGSVDYKPVNLQMQDRSTSVTYAEWIDGDLETDPNSKRPDQFL
jgi:hypothetical protein